MILQDEISKCIRGDDVRIGDHKFVFNLTIYGSYRIDVFLQNYYDNNSLIFWFKEGMRLVNIEITGDYSLRHSVEKLLGFSLKRHTASPTYGRGYRYNNVLMDQPFDLGKFLYDNKSILNRNNLFILDKDLYNSCLPYEKNKDHDITGKNN